MHYEFQKDRQELLISLKVQKRNKRETVDELIKCT